jgi:serine/threonine protein kinase
MSGVFTQVNVEVVIPSTILFIALDAITNPSKISLADCDSCSEFSRWKRLRMEDILVDFRRILRFNSGLPDLTVYLVNLLLFEERSVLNGCNQFLSQTYQRLDDGCLIVVHSINVSNCVDSRELEKELEKEMNLHHPCIAAPMGFVFPTKSSGSQELKIARLFAEGDSLAKILSVNPEWWTPTAKVKAVAGIALGLRFAHSFGLIHGHLTANSIFFDADHRIQIADFGLLHLEGRESTIRWGIGGFSGEGWTPQVDTRAFLSLLFQIIVDHPLTLFNDANSEEIVLARVPKFVLDIMNASRSDSAPRCSFNYIFSILNANDFQILTGVDSEEVLRFVRWVEQSEK